MKKVKIMLSTYNGEAYIEEQLNSLYEQTYPNIEILVRDDGSDDGTLEILRRHQMQGSIRLLEGKNVGYWKSFFYLLDDDDKADYYAFCDQDDVWLPKKVEAAVNALEKIDQQKKVMFFGGFDYYDSDMDFIGKGLRYHKKITFANALFECLPLGCNSVINQSLRDSLIQKQPTQSKSHDWWTFMVASGLGTVVYKDEVLMKYRRHQHNASATGDRFWKLLKFRIKTFFINDYFGIIRKQMKEFFDLYCEELSKEDQRLLLKLVEPSFMKRLSLVCYPHHYRQKVTDDFVVRLLILLGKL